MTMTPERLEEIDGWSFPKGHVIRELLAEVRALQAQLAQTRDALRGERARAQAATEVVAHQETALSASEAARERMRAALERVLAWRDAVEACAPELGAMVMAFDAAREALASPASPAAVPATGDEVNSLSEISGIFDEVRRIYGSAAACARIRAEAFRELEAWCRSHGPAWGPCVHDEIAAHCKALAAAEETKEG